MSHNLSTEYDLVKSLLDGGGFVDDAETKKLVAELKQVVAGDGFDPSHAEALDRLRTRLLAGSGLLKSFGVGANEAKRTLEMSNAYATDKYAGDTKAVRRAAALKLLRHSKMMAKAGSQSLWVVNIPKSYRKWPIGEVEPLASIEGNVCAKLNESRDYFSGTQMRHMYSGVRGAMRWVQCALITLGNHGKDKGQAAELVKRWFETSDTSETDLVKIVSDLTAGFKKIQGALNSNRLTVTDYPPDRGSADERDTEAFVFNGAWKDRLKVIYIERGFFARGANVLSGRDNWARIIVHELSHSEVGTDDYPTDNSYAWQGINPKDAKFAGNTAIRNAENWAYFAGDCAGTINRSERAVALTLP